MQTQALWELFQDTGAPEAYLLYKRAMQNWRSRHGGEEHSMYLKTQGLVLRVTEYRDSDAILSVLTRGQGLMTFKARGVRSRRSQIKSACQLLAFSEFTVLERQGILYGVRGRMHRDVPADAKRH